MNQVTNAEHFANLVEVIKYAFVYSNQIANLNVVSLLTKVPTYEDLLVIFGNWKSDPLFNECRSILMDNCS